MKSQEEFNEWIKGKIENNPQQAPEDVWNQISENLELEDAWNGISKDLELDNLWTSIDSRLHVHQHLMWWERAGAGITTAIALVFISLPLLVQLPLQQNRSYLSQEQQIEQERNGAGDHQHTNVLAEKPAVSGKKAALYRRNGGVGAAGFTQDESKTTAPSVASAPDQAIKTAKTHQYKPAGSRSAIESEAVQTEFPAYAMQRGQQTQWVEEQSILQELPIMHFPLEGVVASLMLQEEKIDLPLLESHDVIVPKQNASFAPAWKIGLGATGRVSSLMNEKTFRAMEKSSLTTPIVSYRSSFSLQVEKSFGQKLALLTDLMLYSETGQRYQEYQGGVYGTTDTELRYSQLNLLTAYAPKGSGLIAKAHTRFLAGVSAGWLHSATLKGPHGITDLSMEYRNVAAAMVLGYEYMVPLKRNIWFGYGLRGHLDLINIYAGTDEIPASFRQTRNSFMDFTISLKYDLK